ncbi:MAG: diguanylate cyclase domain-containing protein [Thermotogota bacterium]
MNLKMRYIIIIIFYTVVIGITITNYNYSKSIIQEKYNLQKTHIENRLKDELRYVNLSTKILEKQLNKEMMKNSQILIDKYIENPKIFTWNLEKIKDDFENYEIYIVNEDMQIIRSTLKEDLGLDFSKYPSFAQLLRKRLEGDEFSADRMDISITTKALRKYSYMPTPDNKYLIELSIDIANRYPDFEKMDLFSKVKNLREDFDLIDNISIFKFNEDGTRIGVIKTEELEEGYDTNVNIDKKEIIRKALNTNSQQNKKGVEKDNFTYTYLPILNYLENDEFDWWNSYVIEIVYTDSPLNQELSSLNTRFITNMIFLSIIFIIFTIIIVSLFKKSENMAYYDHLTGLPNRKLFEKVFLDKMNKAERNNHLLGVMFIDLDHFKDINDNYGHEVGDYLLIAVAERIKNNLKKDDFVSRLGGDEFTIILDNIEEKKDLQTISERIIKLFDKPFSIKKNKINVTPSIGISVYPDSGTDMKELIRKSDQAMYKAKKSETPFMLDIE